MFLDVVLFTHVIGACVLLGTGAGIAFFMVMAQPSRDPAIIAHVAGTVVVADTVFTAFAAIVQPITGLILAVHLGWPIFEGWVLAALCLYVFIGAFWLPVVWIQIQLRNLAREARDQGKDLPDRYRVLYRIWFAFGFPAFAAILAIVWLMLFKPF